MSAAPEPWLRGPIEGIAPHRMPAVHALVQVGEDVVKATEGLTEGSMFDTVWSSEHPPLTEMEIDARLIQTYSAFTTWKEGSNDNGMEQDVVRQYTHGSLERSIVSGLAELGRTSKETPFDQLAAVDEFHMGGRRATAEIAEHLGLRPGLKVLDVGCGIGGTARFLASRYGCLVTGIDITREYVDVGNSLNRRLGLEERIGLHVANAAHLTFESTSFDRATLFHVGMNVPDKKRLFDEVARVIKPDGVFALYDVMRIGNAPLRYPVPWAQTEEISFLQSPDEYQSALQSAGFEITEEVNRRQFALEFFRAMKDRVAEAGPPPLGLHILMGTDAPAKIGNVMAGLESGCIAPVEIIARREAADPRRADRSDR